MCFNVLMCFPVITYGPLYINVSIVFFGGKNL